MAEEKKNLLTRAGLNKLESELHNLKVNKRQEIAEKIKEAREQGDLSENAEYDAAKEEQAEVEERILKVEQMLRNAKIISENEITADRVNVGLKVTVKNVDSGEVNKFIIVGSTESDPFAEPAKISNESEVGKSLLEKQVGDKVEILVPDGMVHYEILAIEK